MRCIPDFGTKFTVLWLQCSRPFSGGTARMISSANVLGNPRAESDRLLEKAFVETVDFRALINTDDFRVVVGRRGTGKSALYQQVRQYYSSQGRILLHSETPQEHYALALQEHLEKLGCNYRTARAACRLLWRGYILVVLAQKLQNHFKLKGGDIHAAIGRYLANQVSISRTVSAYELAIRILERHRGLNPNILPGQIASFLEVDHIEDLVTRGLQEANRRAVMLFDSLDEGWEPSEIPTASLGGLVLTSSDIVNITLKFM